MKYLIGLMFVCFLFGLWRPPQLRRPWLLLALIVLYVGVMWLHPAHL